MTRYIAIDWSGAKTGASKRIWWAEVVDGELVRLECGRTREEVRDELIAVMDSGDTLGVGLDFAFSFPEWYAEQELRADGVADVWEAAAKHGEEWLARCPWPFWGKPGCRKELGEERIYRETEREVVRVVEGPGPKSVFQIGGAGAVGTGSIRGMPILGDLRRAGYSIWPFDSVGPHLIIEIYPRLLTGPVNKGSADEKAEYLDRYFSCIPEDFRCKAACSEDAFDAAVSALVMSRYAEHIEALEPAADPVKKLEGAIWHPPERLPEQHAIDQGSVKGCPFCAADLRTFDESNHAIAIADGYPVTERHTLVIPKTHVASLFDLPASAQADLWRLVRAVRSRLSEDGNVEGFTIGINDGAAAGQTVSHAHVHVIPRRSGDVSDPRGGVRWVVPDQAAYWED